MPQEEELIRIRKHIEDICYTEEELAQQKAERLREAQQEEDRKEKRYAEKHGGQQMVICNTKLMRA